VGEKRSGDYIRHYYRCGAECRAYPWIREEKLNDAVWNSLKEALSDPAIVEQHVEKLRRLRKQKQSIRKQGAMERDAALQEIEAREFRAIAAYRAGSLRSSELANALDEITREKKALDSAQNELWTSASSATETKRTLSDYCRKLVEAMENAVTEKRQQVLRLLISEIAFEGVQVRIRGAITTDQNLFDPQPIDSWGSPSTVGIAAPTSRGLERNPDKMEFEIVAPVEDSYFKESRKAA
jgi:hypothetical protein